MSVVGIMLLRNVGSPPQSLTCYHHKRENYLMLPFEHTVERLLECNVQSTTFPSPQPVASSSLEEQSYIHAGIRIDWVGVG